MTPQSSKSLRERLKWRIAYALDRFPGQCWADLVCWAAFGSQRTPWSPIGDMCRRDAAATGACYCAKLRVPDPPPRR